MDVAGVAMAFMTVAVLMRMAGVAMLVVMRTRVHPHHSTHSIAATQLSLELIGQFDTPPPGMD